MRMWSDCTCLVMQAVRELLPSLFSLASRCDRRFVPLVSPIADRLECRRQRASLLRERIFDAHRRLRDHHSLHDALLLELPQSIAEHAVGDVGNARSQVGKPAAGTQQDEDDGAGPAAPNELNGVVEAVAYGHGLRSGSLHAYENTAFGVGIS